MMDTISAFFPKPEQLFWFSKTGRGGLPSLRGYWPSLSLNNGEEEEQKTLSYEDFNHNLVVINFLLGLKEKYSGGGDNK